MHLTSARHRSLTLSTGLTLPGCTPAQPIPFAFPCRQSREARAGLPSDKLRGPGSLPAQVAISEAQILLPVEFSDIVLAGAYVITDGTRHRVINCRHVFRGESFFAE